MKMKTMWRILAGIEIGDTTWLIGLGRPGIGVVILWIGTHTC